MSAKPVKIIRYYLGTTREAARWLAFDLPPSFSHRKLGEFDRTFEITIRELPDKAKKRGKPKE